MTHIPAYSRDGMDSQRRKIALDDIFCSSSHFPSLYPVADMALIVNDVDGLL